MIVTVGVQVQPPTNVRAQVSGSVVTLTWDYPQGNGPVEFLLDAGTAPSGSNIASGAQIGQGRSQAFGGVPPGTYYARLRSRSGGAMSSPSAEARFTVGSAVSLPGRPSNLVATVSADRTVRLTWVSGGGGAPAAHLLEVGSVAGSSNIGVFVVGASTTTTAAAVPFGTYHVRVRARNAAGTSQASPEIRVTVAQ